MVRRYDNGGVSLGQFGAGLLLNPVGIATDNGGSVYVTESGGDRIRKFACQ